MHKNLRFLLPVPFLLFGCDSSSPIPQGKIAISKVEGLDSYVEIQSAEELNSIARFDDALILVTKQDCSACQKTYEELIPFIKERNYLIYTVDVLFYREAYSSEDNKYGTYANLFPKVSFTPTFLFYRDGALIDTSVGSFPEGKLASELESHFVDLNLYRLNDLLPTGRNTYYQDKAEDIDSMGYQTTLLEKTLLQNENVNVLFTWRRCQDCIKYKNDVLYPFLSERKSTEPLYYYELDGYYLLKRDEDPERQEQGLLLFSAFCQKYGLSLYNVQDILGNLSGVAPSLLVYENAIPSFISVYRNDSNPIRNEDGTLSYSLSFYPEVLSFRSTTKVEEGDTTSKDYRKAIEELRAKADEYEAQACLSFLDEHL